MDWLVECCLDRLFDPSIGQSQGGHSKAHCRARKRLSQLLNPALDGANGVSLPGHVLLSTSLDPTQPSLIGRG